MAIRKSPTLQPRKACISCCSHRSETVLSLGAALTVMLMLGAMGLALGGTAAPIDGAYGIDAAVFPPEPNTTASSAQPALEAVRSAGS